MSRIHQIAMEFYVFLDEMRTQRFQFVIGPDKFDITFEEIIKKCCEKMKEQNPELPLPSSHCSLWYDDISNPFKVFELQKIPDLTKPITSLPTRQFDLILSPQQPKSTHSAALLAERWDEESNSFESYIARANIAIKNDEYPTAVHALAEATKYQKGKKDSLDKTNVFLMMKMKKYQCALEIVQDVLAKNPGASDFQLLLAKINQKLGFHDEAIEQFKRYLIFPVKNHLPYDIANFYIAKSLFAMGQVDQAETLVEPIVNNDPVNVKARVLLAKIFAKQGRLTEALRLVIQNFSIEPDNKGSRRFIGEHVFNEKQIEILKSELGDGMKDANTMFYVGHMLAEFGSCKAADWFMKESMKLHPRDTTILVGTLLNYLCLSPSPEEFFEFAKSALATIAGMPTEIKSVSENVDLSKPVSDFDKEEAHEADKLREFGPASEESDYSIESYDAIWTAMLIHTYMFTHGYLSDAETLASNVKTILDKYTWVFATIRHDVDIYKHMSSIVPTIPRPLRKLKPIFVLGDENSFALAWRSVKLGSEDCQLVPIYIHGVYASEVCSTVRNSQQTAYRIECEKLPDNSNVILCMTHIDYNDSIYHPNFFDPSCILGAITGGQIDCIVKIAKHLATTKNCRVWVHPVMDLQMHKRDVGYLVKINEKLGLEVWSVNQTVPNLRMLDIFDALTEDAADGTKAFNPRYVTPVCKTLPECLPLVEKSLNATESNLDKYFSHKQTE